MESRLHLYSPRIESRIAPALVAIALALTPACGDPSFGRDRFAIEVSSYQPSDSGGFGSEDLPGIVLGPPVGGGEASGGTDVVSLGCGGSIVLRLGGDGAADGPGADFIVFENAFISGSDGATFAEPGEVSVSDDGSSWHTFACEIEGPAPLSGCAGVTPVLSSPASGIDPTDPAVAGGDAFDLADVGLGRALFVRIVDRTLEWHGPGLHCTAPTGGFDLDAVSIVHGR